MSSKSSQCSDPRAAIVDAILEAGATKVGIAAAKPVDEEACRSYTRWLADGHHADMDYLQRHALLRRHPAELLEGCRSVIVAAFNYFHTDLPDPDALQIALYAHGQDYHKVLRRRLKPVARLIQEKFGANARICVDTAPLMERYWARQAGLGFIGRNGMLILPGHGSYFFLATILTTLPLSPHAPCTLDCGHCMRCVANCPSQALRHDSTVAAHRCLSYLTIEHRGPFPEGTSLCGHFYGCDECQRHCPHNSHAPETAIEEFKLRPELRHLTKQQILTLTPEQYAALTAGSAIARAPLASLRRNAEAMRNEE